MAIDDQGKRDGASHWASCQTRLRYKYRKRTRTIFSNLEDHYLRGDISCGFDGCHHCIPAASTGLTQAVPFICIPDAHALLEFLEVWEMQDLSNVVICTSVLQKLSILGNMRKVVKLRSLYRDQRRHVYLFDDLHCQWISGGREGDPSELLPEVAGFYWDHLDQRVPVIVVSGHLSALHPRQALPQQLAQLHLEDAGVSATGPGSPAQQQQGLGLQQQESGYLQHQQQQLVLLQGFSFLSPAAFFGLFFKEGPSAAVYELFDSLLQTKHEKEHRAAAIALGDPEATAQAAATSREVKPYWSQIMVEEGLIQGELLQGVLHVSMRNPREAVVQVGNVSANSALGRLVRVSGRQACNRALHGDKVAVRLLPQAPGVDTPTANGADPQGWKRPEDFADGDLAKEEDGVVDNAAQIALGVGAIGGESVGDAPELVVEGEGTGDEEGAAAVLSSSQDLELLPMGEVVALLQRSTHSLVSCLSQQEEEALMARAGGPTTTRQEAVLVVPYDRRLPYVRGRTRKAERLLGQRFVVRVDGWDRTSRYPDGHMVKIIGPINDLRSERETVLEHAGITWQPFCSGALAELPAVPGGNPHAWTVPPAERARRRDLTGPEYFVASIDPVGCTDVDDTLHVRALPNGCAEVGVHIADVSYFVRAGSMLDGEARDRCTSVYLVDRRLDMLPSLLSEQLCSLRQGRERLAVSVIWTLESSTSFAVQDVWFGRTIIRSRHELHYQQAQDIADGKPPAPGDELPPQDRQTLASALDVLIRLTRSLHATRVANGALDLSSSELRFQTDEQGQPVAVKAKPKVPMMDVVAEMMIWANAAVAQRTATAFPGAALLRNHPPPREEAFEQVQAVFEQGALGPSSKILANVDPSNNQSLSKALEDACRQASGKDAAVAQLLKSLTTRAMSEAKYFSTGAAAPGSAGTYHYGLALQYYTHFTSPIRRYADVVAHRQLLAALQCNTVPHQQQGAMSAQPPPPPPIPHAELMIMADRMNEQHRASKAAQKECMELYLLLFLHSKPHVESALLVGIQGRDQLDVFVPSIQMRGRVRVADSKGGVRPPLTGTEEQGEAMDTNAIHALTFVISEDKNHASIVDVQTNVPIWSASVLGRLWLMLSADGSRAHGPRLCMRLAATTHPMVQAKQAELAAAEQEESRAGAASAQAPPQGISTAAQQMLSLRGIALPTPATAHAPTPAAPTANDAIMAHGLPHTLHGLTAPDRVTPQPQVVQPCVLHAPAQPTLQPAVAQPSSLELAQAELQPLMPELPSPAASSPVIQHAVLHPPAHTMTPQPQQQLQQMELDTFVPDVEDVLQGGGPVPEVMRACSHMPVLSGMAAGPRSTARLLRHCQAAVARYEARIAKAPLKNAGSHKQAWRQRLLVLQQYISSLLPVLS